MMRIPSFLTLFLSGFLMLSCRTLITVGAVENVLLEDLSFSAEARTDTGAAYCSLGADRIVVSRSDEKVFFTLNGERYCLPLAETVTVRRSDTDEIRPVVMLSSTVRGVSRRCGWTLSDRSRMKYPALIGRNWLSGTAVVDVSE